MKKIKIAQIGTSRYSHGKYIWQSIVKQNDVFDVVGYAFPENEREKFPEQMDVFKNYREMTVEEILNDPEIEAVAVETEEIYLTEYALKVVNAGKHLHMEKPGGTDIDDFCELVERLKEKKLAFTTGYMYRFNPTIRYAIERARRGDLGKIYAVEAQMSCKHDPVWRQWLDNFPGGMMFFLGCHLVDMVYRIQGEPTSIIPLSCSTGIDGVNTVDYGMTVFKYENGVSFVKTCDNEKGGFSRRQLVICGEKGTIEIKPLESPTACYECYDNDAFGAMKEYSVGRFERYDAMMRNFAEIIRGKENPYSYDYELNLYKLVLRCCGKEV